MTRILFTLLATTCASHALAQARIDASTPTTFNSSLTVMKQELSQSKAAQLNAAIAMLPFAGMRSFKDTPSDGAVKLDIKKIDGMTADQVIELARNTVSVKISIGPPPGLPDEYKAKLRDASGSTTAPPLVGTTWDLTENLNGFITHRRVTLRNEGVMDDGTAGHGHWEQLGGRVRIAFNDDYAVYLGTLEDSTSLKGSAANVNGSEWTWTGRRSP